MEEKRRPSNGNQMNAAKRKAARRKRKQRLLIIKSVILVLLLCVLGVGIFAIAGGFNKKKPQNSGGTITADNSSSTSGTSASSVTVQPQDAKTVKMAEAQTLAVQYDYDGAMAKLGEIENADQDADVITKMAEYQAAKSSLVAWDPVKVTHVFYHSLVVDPAKGFSLTGDDGWDNATKGWCQWMTTVEEFNRINDQMYANGYVLVALSDLYTETTDENGTVHITTNQIMLPEGKKPFVLSLDDLCYYHSYNGRGTATRMIVGDDGKPTCEYVDENGQTQVGAYDCVPLLDQFIETHPDFSYKGAKGTIALTGYNGILGYRTDGVYQTRNPEDLDRDQSEWLAANPNFNYDNDVAEAKKVAEAIKADGWTFASHTWGHIKIGDASMESLQSDTQKWLTYVEPLVGDTDVIIFAHGQDLANWNEDYASTAKFQYLKSQGFNVYCNVDSSQYYVESGDLYFRMGRRNLDGYRMYHSKFDNDGKIADLFDVNAVWDDRRPTDASLYTI
ncbi:MAG: polysaccharide deacetylase [Lachnospiraceae bacterium]|nr:polysaccharide deacetylase [Lachnospiraceae bacterium]